MSARRAERAVCLAFAASLTSAAAPEPSAADAAFAGALSSAYTSNPLLLEQRRRLRQTDEGVPRALSGWRPRVTIDASGGVSAVFDRFDTRHQPERRVPQQAELLLTQPLYTGGKVRAQVTQAETLVLAERAGLQATEAQVLLQAATAFLDVALDERLLALNDNEARILARTLQASAQAGAAGALTQADVAQARARLADQQAVLAASVSALAIARAQYQQAVGEPAGALAMPDFTPAIPRDLDAALALTSDNFDVSQARAAVDASKAGVDIARAGLRPRIVFELYGARVAETEVQAPHQRDNVAEAAISIAIPLYQGGEQAAEIRQAKEAASVSLLQADVVIRQAGEEIRAAWAQLTSARSRIAAYNTSYEANLIAERGVERQHSVGQRTLIEVLNTQQEKLMAAVNVLTARHDALLASLRLAAATGRLDARALRLDVALYDPIAHYDETRDRWYGTQPAP